MIIVPEKLVVGLCFADCDFKDNYPHLTLIESKTWTSEDAQSIVETTCGRHGAFEQAYLAAEDRRMPD